MSNLVLAKPQLITTVQKALVVGKNTLVKQSPIILAGIGISGVVTTSVLAARGSIRANELIREAEFKKGEETGDCVLTTREKLQAGWKPYAPAIISGTLTVAAIVASTTISQKRQTALAGLYALSETALKEYQDKIEATYGPKEVQKIRDEINGDRVKNASVPPWDDSVLPQGTVQCFDKLTGRKFSCSAERLKRAENDLNAAILGGDMCASLNELYSLIDSPELPCCTLGEEVGWNLEHLCRMYFTSCLTSDMKPCLVLDYVSGNEPSYTYRDI